MSRCYRQLFILSPSCFSAFFFFNDPATTEIYTLSLHDALPISVTWDGLDVTGARADRLTRRGLNFVPQTANVFPRDRKSTRLNSSHVKISYAVFCLKKKKNKKSL